MRISRVVLLSVLVLVIGVGAALGAASASFVFDFVSDPGDLADGPDFNVTGSGLVDDGGGCDIVVMVMVDPTGTATDLDTFCLSLVTGQGGSDGDYGSQVSGYTPVSSPVTYGLFDIDAADIAALSGTGDAEQAYVDYVLANGACLTEQFLDVSGLPTAAAYSLCGGGTAAGCTLNIPSGSVVGEAPLGAQVYYSPGNIAPSIVLNPGTYIVVGQDESETYYKVVLACQFLWVRKDTMQPSFQAPQNGAPLPTRIVS
jgi:hypothetical protein